MGRHKTGWKGGKWTEVQLTQKCDICTDCNSKYGLKTISCLQAYNLLK